MCWDILKRDWNPVTSCSFLLLLQDVKYHFLLLYQSVAVIHLCRNKRERWLWVSLLSSTNQWNCERWSNNTFTLLPLFMMKPLQNCHTEPLWNSTSDLFVYAALRCLLCADEATGYGPVFEEQPVETIYPEESPEAKITMSCRARASPPATYT